MNSKEKSKSIPTILITGFGPFRSVRLNPSWQVAKALQTYLEWTRPVHIVLQQLQVTYDDVTTKVPRFWSEYNPLLVVHLGVAPGATEIRIERCACNNDYCHIDNNGCAPETGQCILTNAPVMLTTGLPLDDIYERLQKQRPILPVIISDNAGRYLCEYIYYRSLFINSKRTVFIHIPDLNEKFTVENLAETIQLIIYELLRVVEPMNDQENSLK